MNLPGTLAPFPAGRRPALAAVHGAGAGWQWRALASNDLPWLATLYASTREAELQGLMWPAQLLQQFLAQQFSAQHQHYLAHFPQAHYLAIEVGGQAVGRLYLDESAEHDQVVDISLLPDRRGHGIGGAVIMQVQASAALRGRSVALHVLANNVGAQRLYQRLGFVAQHEDTHAMYQPMRWPAPAASVS